MRAVLERDFISQVATGRAVAVRSAIGGFVTLTVLAALVRTWGSLEENPDVVGRAMFLWGGATLLALLVLVTPPLVVGSILGEREQGTLDLVLAAPVPPRTLVLSKLLARCGVALTWAAGALGPLAVALLIGGVSGKDVISLVVLGAAVVLELAAWGVLVSAWCRRLATGAILAYFLPFARWGLVALLFLGIAPTDAGTPEEPAHPARWWALYQTTPFPAVERARDAGAFRSTLRGTFEWRPEKSFHGNSRFSIFVFAPGTVLVQRVGRGDLLLNPGGIRPGRSWVWNPKAYFAPPDVPRFAGRPLEGYVVFVLLFGTLAILAAAFRLRREGEPRGSPWLRFLRRRRWIRPPPERGNPVAWKEGLLLNTFASRPLYFTVLAVVLVAEAAFWEYAVRHRGEEVLHAALVVAAGQAAALAMVAGLAAAMSMAHEASMGTLDLLRISGLAGVDILRGKIRGILTGMGLLLLVPLLHLVALVATGIFDPVTALVGVGATGLLALFWICLGLRIGIGTLNARRAMFRVSALFGLLLAGGPLAVGAIDLFGRGLHFQGLRGFLLGASPPLTHYGTLGRCLSFFRAELWWDPDPWSAWAPAWAAVLFAGSVFLAIRLPRLLDRRFAADDPGIAP